MGGWCRHKPAAGHVCVAANFYHGSFMLIG